MGDNVQEERRGSLLVLTTSGVFRKEGSWGNKEEGFNEGMFVGRQEGWNMMLNRGEVIESIPL